MKNLYTKSIVLGGLMLVGSFNAYATKYFSQSSGVWSTLARWNTAADGSGSAPPAATEFTDGTNDFEIQDGHNIDADLDLDIDQLTIGGGASGRLRVGNDATIRNHRIRNDINVNAGATFETGTTNAIHTVLFEGGIFTNNGNNTNFWVNASRHTVWTIQPTAFVTINGTGIHEFGGLVLDGSGTNKQVNVSSRIQIREPLTLQNTVVVTTSARWDSYNTVNFNAGTSFSSTNERFYCSGNQTLNFTMTPTFNDFYLDNGTKTINGVFIVDDQFYVYNDAIVNSGSGAGYYIFHNRINLRVGAAMNLTGTFYMDGSFAGSGSIYTNGGGTFALTGIDIHIDGPIWLPNNINYTIDNGSVRVMSGYFNLNTSTFEHTAGANTDSLYLAPGTTMYLDGTDNFPDGYNTYDFDRTSWTVYEFDGATQTVRSAPGLTYGRIRIEDGNVKQVTGTGLDMEGRLTINDGTTLEMGALTHTIAGQYLNGNGGTMNSTGTITLDGVDVNQYIQGGGAVTWNFNNLIFDNISPTAVRTKYVDVDIAVVGNFTAQNTGGNSSLYLQVDMDDYNMTNIGAGVFTIGPNVWWRTSGATDFSTDVGTFASSDIQCGSVVWFDGNVQSIPGNGAPASFNGAYGSIYLSGNGAKTPQGPLDICDDVDRRGNTPLFTDAGFSHTVGGDWLLNTIWQGPMTGTIDFDGTNQTVSNSDFWNIVFSNGGTKSISGDIDVDSSFTVATGVTVSTNDMIYVAKDVSVAGTGAIQQGGEDFVLDGTLDQTVTFGTPASSYFEDFIINKTAGMVFAGSDFTVNNNFVLTQNNGDFDLNGNTVHIGRDWDLNTGCTFTHNNGTLDFNGTVDQDIWNEAVGQTYFNMTFSGAGEKRFRNNVVDIDGDVTLTSATLDQLGTNVTVAGNWNNTGGTYQGYARTTFDGNNQNIDASDFHDFYTATSGTKTLDGAIKVTGDLLIGNATNLDGNGFEISVEEEWYNDQGGTYTHGNGKVTFIGGAFNIYSGGTGAGFAFYNLEVNLQSTVNTVQCRNNDVDIDGDLTITQGVLYTNNVNMNIAGGMSVTSPNGTWNHGSNGTTLTFDGTSGTHSILPGTASRFRNTTFNAPGATYNLTGNLTLLGNRDLTMTDGTLDANGNKITLQGGGADFFVNGGTFEVDSAAILEMPSGSEILITGGTFRMVGVASAPAQITASSGTFRFRQTGAGATMHGLYYSINGTNNAGLDIQAGSIDATNNLSYGSFSGGVGTAYMTIASGSYGAPATLIGNTFSINGATPADNCRHTAGQQMIFQNASGSLSGYVYELDDQAQSATLGLIQWTYPGAVFWDGNSDLDGGDGTSWEDPLNWAGDAIPLSTQVAIIDHSNVAAAINVDIDAATAVCQELQIDAQGGAAITVVLNGANLDIGTDGISIGAGTTLTQTNATDTIFTGGDWSNAGTFNENSAVVVFDDTSGTQTITTQGLGDPFNSLVFNGAGQAGTATFILSNDLDANGTFTMNGGVFDVQSSANLVRLSGDFTVNGGSIEPRTGTFQFDQQGTATQNISGGIFYRFQTVNGGAGTNTKLIANNIEVREDVRIGANTILDGSTRTIFVADDWQNDAGAGGFTQTGDGTVIFNGTNLVTQDIGNGGGATTFNKVYIQGSGNKNITQNMTVNDDMYIIAGIATCTVSSGVVIDGSGASNTFTMTGGNLRIVGTNDFPRNFEIINLNAGEVQYRADIDQFIYPTRYYNLRLRGEAGAVATRKTASGSFTVQNNLDMDDHNNVTLDMNDSTFFHEGGGWQFNAAGPQVDWGTACGTGTYHHLGAGINIDPDINFFNNIIWDGTGQKTQQSNWTMTGDLEIQSNCTHYMNTYTLRNTQTGCGNIMTINGGGGLRSRVAVPDTAFPTNFGTYTLDVTSLVNLDLNGDQNIFTNGGALEYGDLDLNQGGNKNIIGGDLDVEGIFDQNNNNALVDNGNDIYFGGTGVYIENYTPTVGTTVYFDYFGDQTINNTDGGSQTMTFENLVFGGSGTKDILNDIIDVGGNTTINNGVTVDFNEQSYWAGNLTNNGRITTGWQDCFNFDGTTTQTIDPGPQNRHEFYCVVFDNGGAANPKDIVNNGLHVGNGDFTVTNDAELHLDTLDHYIASLDFFINGTWDTDSANFWFDRAGGQNLPALTQAADITIATSGNKVLQGNWDLIDDLTIDPTCFLDANNGNDYNITLTGNWTNNGTFYDRLGTVAFESNDGTAKTIQTNGSQFYNLTFNQAQTNTRTYRMQDNVTMNNNVTIGSGATLDLNGTEFTLGNNDAGNPAGETITVQAGGTLEVDDNAFLRINTQDNLTDAGITVDGTLRVVGSAGNYATVTREAGNTYFYITINGTLQANYYGFNYLNATGLNLTAGSSLDPVLNLSEGSFSNMPAGLGFTYITFETDMTPSPADIINVVFNHPGSPGVGTDYNVTRTRADGGIVNFNTTISGLLAGENYDNDPNGDVRVTWPAPTVTNWTGNALTTDWFTAGNWDNGVPTTALDAVIDVVTNPYPIIDAPGAVAKTVTIPGGYLRLDAGFDLDVEGDFVIGTGTPGTGVVAILNSGCQINAAGGWSIGASGVFSHGNGTVELDAVGGTVQIQPRTQSFGNLTISGNSTYTLSGDMDIDNNMTLSDGILTPLTNNYDITCAGNWNSTGGELSTAIAGTVTLDGTGAQAVTRADFYDLDVSGSGTKTFNDTTNIIDDLTVNSDLVCAAGSNLNMDGDVLINASGSFDDGGATHQFAGTDWTGTGGFPLNTGTIEFNRLNGTQFIDASKFNNLTFNGTSQIRLRNNVTMTGDLYASNTINTIRCDTSAITNSTGTGTFTLEAGEFIYCGGNNSYPGGFNNYAVDPTSFTYFNGAGNQTIRGGAAVTYGNLICTNTTTKTLSGDINVDGYLDFNDATIDANNFDISVANHWYNQDNGSFIPGTGTVTFDGNTDPHYIYTGLPANGSKAFGNMTVNKSGGILYVVNEDCYIGGDFSLVAGTFTQNGFNTTYSGNFQITGGTFTTSGTSIFNKTGGLCQMLSGGQTLNNVIIADVANTFRMQDDFDINGNFTLGASATFRQAGNDIILGNYLNTVTINGEYRIEAGGTMNLARLATVTVSSTGTFEAVGASGNVVTITRETTNDYNFIVDGTIKANYYTFDYMGTGGIQINSGATIDATDHFQNGTFSNPAVGGTCLRVENNQSFTGASRIENVAFTNNPGGGAANVTKTTSTVGTLEFYAAVGIFSGESFDNDPSNIIDWTGPQVLIWNGSVSTDWYNPNNWTPAFGPNIIPDTTTDAIVPFVVTQPIITTEGAKTKSLEIQSGANVRMATADNALPDLKVYGDLQLDGIVEQASTNDSMTVEGNWTRSATGTLNMNDGSVTFTSSSATVTLINGPAVMPNVFINVTGKLVLGDDLIVGQNFTINTGRFQVSTGNYTVECRGNFENNNNFDAFMGTVEFTGTSGGTIDRGTSRFYDVEIDCGAGTYTRAAGTNFNIDHVLTVNSGTLDLAGGKCVIGDQAGTDDGIAINGGTLEVDAGATLNMSNLTRIDVNSGGTLRIVGSGLGSLATVTNNSTGRYYFNVKSGGTIHALFYTIGYLQTQGLYVEPGGIVDATNNFSYGHFVNGPTSGQMLRIENTQNFTGASRIEYVEFAGTGSVRNCRKTSTTPGAVVFYWAYGTHQGETFENDAYDQIFWDANMVWTGAVDTSWNTIGNWDNEMPLIPTLTVPTNFTDVIIPSGGGIPNEPTIDAVNALADDIEVFAGRTLTIVGGTNLTTTDTMWIAGGTVDVTTGSGTSRVEVGGTFDATGGTFNSNTNSILAMQSTRTDTHSVNTGGNTLCGFEVNTNSINNGLVQTASALDIDCDMNITRGTFEVVNAAHTINLAGTWNNDNTTASQGFIGGPGTVIFDGGGVQTVTHDGGTEAFGHITVSNTAGSVSLNDNISAVNVLLDNNTTLNANSFDVLVDSNWTNNNAAVGGFTNPGLVHFTGSNLQVVTAAAGTETFGSVTVSNPGIVRLDDTLDIAEFVTINDGATLQANDVHIYFGRNWVNNNTVASTGFTAGNGTVIMDGTVGQAISHAGGTETMNNLHIQNVTGNTSLSATNLDLAGDLTIDDGGNFRSLNNNINIAGDWTNNHTTADAGFEEGVATVTFDGTANQQISHAGSSETFSSLVIGNAAAATVTSNTPIVVSADFTINNDGDFDANSNNMNVAGNWTNSNAVTSTGFTPGTARVTFDGAAAQNISQTGGNETFYDIRIANSLNGANAIVLGSDVTASNRIIFSDGVIGTGANRLINSNTDSAGLFGFSSTSFVNGNLRKFITNNTQTYPLPVGQGFATTDYYRADIINNGMVTTSYLDAEVHSVTEAGNNIDSRVSLTENTYVYTGTYGEQAEWGIVPDAQPTGGDYGVRLYTANIAGLIDNQFFPVKRASGSTDYADFNYFVGTTVPGVGQPGRTIAGGYAERLGYTAFSLQVVGGTNPPLPIDLLSFNAMLMDNHVLLSWTTSTETNNDFFTIERSTDGVNFTSVGIVDGAGTSTQPLSYTFKDQDPFSGTIYYRLRQTDFDGTTEVFNIVSVHKAGHQIVEIFPNPAKDYITIHVQSDDDEIDDVKIVDARGKVVFSTKLHTMNTTLQVEHLASGVYTIHIRNKYWSHQDKIVITK